MLSCTRPTSRRFGTVARTLIFFSLTWAASGMLMAQTPISGINWFPIGPADISNGQTYGAGRPNVSGRATVITVNPKNPSDVWLGTATGGVWHSANGGVNWLPMSDNEASLSIGAIALDGCSPAGCAVVYAGTGENSIRRDTYYGMGLLVGTTSGGEFPTFGWTLQGANIFKFASINNVVLDPGTSGGTKVVYVTLSSGETASATESTVTAPAPPQGYGIFKSTDNASTWAKLSVPGGDGFKPTDLEMDPNNSQILYVGFMGRGVFKTKDGGAHWCPLNPGLALPPGCVAAAGLPNPTVTTFDHVQIAVSPPSAGSQVIYVEQGNCTSFIIDSCLSSIFKSSDGGSTWTQASATTAGCVALSVYSRYTHGLTVDPKNSSTLFLGGVYLYKSTDGGNTFCDAGTNTVHPDHHAIAYPDPNNESLVLDASDGGFAISNDGGNTWNSGNSDLQITQFQSVASSSLTARIIGGTQDNGTEMWVGTRIWDHRFDGDGGFTILDQDDAMTMFATNYYISAAKSTDGGSLAGWSYIENGITSSDPAAFYAPIIEAPSGGHNLYYGTNRLYQSTNKGGLWTVVSPTLGGTTTTFPDIGTTNVITAIAVAPSNANRIYIGYYDGEIFMTNSACSTSACWTSISKNLPSAPVTRIAVDPNNADIAYATFSGFSAGAHVFKSVNGGGKWSPSASGLPSIPADTITLETSSILWVGTDDGVYRSPDSGASWTRYGNGLPHVPVYEIAIDSGRGRLYAATQGRGTFILTQPFLSNFEGWVNNDIWDIPVYGSGFAPTVGNPAGSPCTMQLIQQNGAVCASSTVDAMGGNITFDNSGTLVTSKNTFWNGKPVAWGCFNGNCIGGKTIAQCNPPGNPITSVVVSCGGEVGIDHILGCPAQANPPSSILGLSGMPGAGAGGGAAGVGGAAAPGAAAAAAPLAAPTAFDLIPSVQARNGVQVLCTASVQLGAGETPLQALIKTRDAVNSTPACQQRSVSAVVRGVPPEAGLLEDLLASPPRLAVRAPGVVGGQLFTSLRAAPGSATGECFDVNGIGSPIQNQVAVMKVDLETAPGGAAGGAVTVMERSNLGVCLTKVKTDPGETAAQIATSLANLFQASGVPGPASCRAIQNPRDIVADGTSIVSVVASELQVCNSDRNVGLLIGPKELPNVQHRALQYAAKFLCGSRVSEAEGGRRNHGAANAPRKGKENDEDDERRHDFGVAQGRYYTAVNVHNPTEKPAAIRVKFAAADGDGKPGRLSRFVDMSLAADEVVSIDCYQIARLLESKQGFIDGFAVLESDVELDVVAVYTAAGREGGVQTLHTERVPARLQQ
jgi:hypothetical protein